MTTETPTSPRLSRPAIRRDSAARSAVVILAISLLAALTTASAVTAPDAAAQADVVVQVWTRSDAAGAVANPRTWDYRQSCDDSAGLPNYAGNDCQLPLMDSLEAALLTTDVNDGTWTTATGVGTGPIVNDRITGINVGNHFRKEFTLAEIGYQANQIAGIQFSVFHDDAAVVYLNGVEVYRSIRGNLDPTYAEYPLGTGIPIDASVPFGGAEWMANDDVGWADVPNFDNDNACEQRPGCTDSPWGDANPPAVPVSLLRPNDTNVWAVTVFNRNSNVSSLDMTFDHTFDLLIDPAAIPIPQKVRINEVVASNETSWLIDTDGDGVDESPDWIELHNFSNSGVNLAGWQLVDSAGSYALPAVTIAAGGYLLVAANDCQIGPGQTCTSPPQAPFRISSGGETLRLVRSDSIVEDEYIGVPPQVTDVSWGRAFDSGAIGYLSTTTPGAANTGAAANLLPVLRPFADRLYNVGETIDEQLDGFDPDGAPISYALSGAPVTITDPVTGHISGIASPAGVHNSVATVTDPDGTDTQGILWRYFDAAAGGSPMVLNEYNAVISTSAIGSSPLGNDGDWFEFLVVDDGLDIRGWTVELWDRKGDDDNTRLAASVTFADRPELASIPAGTIIVIGELVPNDLSFDAVTDWTIELRIDNSANGVFFEQAVNETFSATRLSQAVVIYDAAGVVRTPLSGETEAWDQANGGVSEEEVMNLCIDPVAGSEVDPVLDYRDNGDISTRGEPNQCRWDDAAGANTFDQNLNTLRGTATFGAGSGDVNCDGQYDLVDARMIAQFTVALIADSGPCHFASPGPGVANVAAGDVNSDGVAAIDDARIVVQCTVGLNNAFCP